jgi:hypothetical protein
MTTTTETERPRVPPLTGPERGLLASAAVLGVGVGGLGLVSSFEAVSAAGARWGFATPALLPVGIDIAIPVFTVVNLLLIRMNMPLAWVRFVPWALTLVTCWLNVAAGSSVSAKVAHGTMPLLWVVLSEVAAHVYAVRIGAVTGRRMEKIRRSRWLLAPVSTFLLWRRMTLWEVTSYADALARERERLLARAELRERYGRGWRRTTPRRTRVLLKLGEHAPTAEPPAPAPPADSEPEAPATSGEIEQDTARPEPGKRPARRPAKTARRTRPARSFEDLLAEARQVTADWPTDRLKADPIRTALRCGAGHARALRDALRAERAAADGRPLHAVDDDPDTTTDTPESEPDDAEGEAA